MPDDDDNDDLDAMTADQLRALKQEVLLRIEEDGALSSASNSMAAEDIRQLDELLEDIEVRLAELDEADPGSDQS